MTKILIDSGPSSSSTHFASTMNHCGQLLAFRHVTADGDWSPNQGVRFPPREPLIRGTLIHTGYAHIFARIRQQQCGLDPDVYYTPAEATKLVGRAIAAEGPGQQTLVNGILERCVSIVSAYEREMEFFQDRVLYVEDPFVFTITPPRQPVFAGRCHRCSWNVEPLCVYATIFICPHCKSTGETTVLFYRYTRKPDVVWQQVATERVKIVDHKTMMRAYARTVRRYAPTIGFIAYDLIGFSTWGQRYDGIIINAVEMQTGNTKQQISEPAPEMLRRFPSIVHDAETRRRTLLDARTPASEWPRQASEYVCFTPYGACDALELCLRGGEARPDVEFDPHGFEFELEGFAMPAGRPLLTQLRAPATKKRRSS